MFTKPWIFLSNPFQTAVGNSFIQALKMSTVTDAALAAAKADAAIATLYAYYHPIHLAYVAAYDAWVAQGGTQKGSTVSLTTLLKGLTPKINLWDAQISIVYAKGSGPYVALLPSGHAPFISGKQSARIAALQALDANLTPIVALATTKTDVHNYATAIDNANNTQKGAKTTTNSNSSALELARTNMCNACMYVYGGLLQKFSTNLEKVGDFFDLELLRNSKQTEFTGSIKPNSIKKAMQRTLAANTNIVLKNTGLTELVFYLAPNAISAPAGASVTLMPQEQKQVLASELGDVLANHFLNIQNQDAAATGNWTIDIL